MKNSHIAMVIVALGLSACGHSSDQLAYAERLSCPQLAQELGRYEERRDDAAVDGFVSDLVSIVADNESDRREAGFDSAISSLEEADADLSLEQLAAIYKRKGCPAL